MEIKAGALSFDGVQKKQNEWTEYHCAHCFQVFQPSASLKAGEKGFCCQGCKTVYLFLEKNDLKDFYRYQQESQSVDEHALAELISNRSVYSFLDDPEFRAEKAPGLKLDFYLENAHCASCVWLMDQLPYALKEDVAHSQLNIGTKVVQIQLKENGSFQKVLKFLLEAGYKAQPLLEAHTHLKLKYKENKKLLFQTGIAAACAGNIMILATAVYAGADPQFTYIFEWLTFFLSLPVLIYSAQSFYEGAYRSAKSQKISIDMPVVLAIVGGSVMSFYHLVLGSPHQYFDSLVLFVFLLLLGRLFQKRVEEEILSRVSFERLGQPKKARIAVQGKLPYQWRETFSEKVNIHDILKVEPGEVVPVDGVVLEGRSLLQLSFLTGESEPVSIQPQMNIYAGSVNIMDSIIVQAQATAEHTRLGKILSEIQKQVFISPLHTAWVDQVARYFLWGVLSLCALVLVYSYFFTLEDPLLRILALLIVACPCALAIATPLTYALMMSVGVKEGVFILKSEVLEKLKKIKNIFFDKTGTLTLGEFAVKKCHYQSTPFSKNEIHEAIVSLESLSKHPIAKSLVKKFQGNGWISLASVSDFNYSLLRGVEGVIKGRHWKIFRAENCLEGFSQDIKLQVFCDDQLQCEIYLQDALKEEAHSVIHRLKKRGFNLFLLSGDKKENCLNIAKELSLEEKNVFYSKTPEEKNEIIKKHSNVLMCGDGVNDAFALSSAHVGVALHGGIESCVDSSDVYIQNKDLTKLLTLFEISKGIKKTLKRNLFLSLIYNFTGVLGALLGYVTPLFAAFFMPLSSLTVVLSSLYGAWAVQEKMREKK